MNTIEKLEVEYGDPDELRLKENVYIGYVDIAAAGCRALLGIDMRVEYFELPVTQLSETSLRPACVRSQQLQPLEQHFKPLQVLNCKYEQFSIIVVNSVLKQHHMHFVAKSISDLIRAAPSIRRVTLLSTAGLKGLSKVKQRMYENCFHSSPVTTFPPLRNDVPIDSFLALLLQFLRLEKVPLHLVSHVGKLAHRGRSSDKDGSEEIIDKFIDLMTNDTRLQFNRTLSHSLEFLGNYDTNADMKKQMYF